MTISKGEQLLTLAEAAQILPRVGGKKIHTSTLWRWCKKGLRGINLEYVCVGSKTATSSEALNRFFIALADADKVNQSCSDIHWPRKRKRPTNAARQRSINEANEILLKAGIIKQEVIA